jgi:hypothetical protein
MIYKENNVPCASFSTKKNASSTITFTGEKASASVITNIKQGFLQIIAGRKTYHLPIRKGNLALSNSSFELA